MKLITEYLDNTIKLLVEDSKEGKDHFIKGIFMQAEAKNRNGRIYPVHILHREVNRYNKDVVAFGRALGEMNHPENPTINLERVSHQIKELTINGTDIYGKAKILNTPYGKIVKEFLLEGIPLGVSSRGMGSLLPRKDGVQEVQEDFHLCTVDIVADPSAPDAFVQGIMEGKEWVWDNGIVKEVNIEAYKRTIQETNRKQLEEQKLKVFENFIKSLSSK